MNWQIIHKLLDQLDSSLNSNSFWIELSVPAVNFTVEEILLLHLKAGTFQHAIVKQDLERGWDNYSEMVFPKNQPTQLQYFPRPGKLWNGKDDLDLRQISPSLFASHLVDQLSGKGQFYSPSSIGTTISEEEGEILAKELTQQLQKADENWKVFQIQPNFLFTVEEAENAAHLNLGYFENFGRDSAFGILAGGSFYVLLTNGYQ